MRTIFSLGLLIFNYLICQTQNTQIPEESDFDLKSGDLTTILNIFNSISEQVENVYQNDTSKLELYLQLDKEEIIKKVTEIDDTPESYFAAYHLIRNNNGHIIYIAEFPASRSGDWNLIYENYFDGKGNLIAFIRKSSFFNGICAEIVHEKSEYYYNLHHILIKKTYEITGKDNKPLDFNDCVFHYRYNYVIHKTLIDYLKNHKFEN